MRKPSPISTSSPRETITSPSRLVAASASSTAAALLLTTSASAAPVRAHSTSRTWRWRVARSPRGQVDLEIGVRAGGGGDRGERLGRQQRASQVGVGDDAGGVDHAPQRRRDGRRDQLLDPGREVGGREGGGVALSPALDDLAPQALDDGAHGPHDDLARVGLGERRDRRLAQHLVDGGQAAQRLPARPAAGALAGAAARRPAEAPRSQQRHLADRTVHDLADRPAAGAALPELGEQPLLAFGRHRDEQSARGLRVDQGERGRLVERPTRSRATPGSRGWRAGRRRTRSSAIRPCTSRRTGTSSTNTSAATPLASSISRRWPSRPKPVTSVQACAPTAFMAAAAAAVQRRRLFDGRHHLVFADQAALEGGGQHADAEPLGQHQPVAGAGAAVVDDLVAGARGRSRPARTWARRRRWSARRPGRRRPRSTFSAPPRSTSASVSGLEAGRPGEQVEGRDGRAAHGIHVGERVGGGDLPEPVAAVDDGREEVDRLHAGSGRRPGRTRAASSRVSSRRANSGVARGSVGEHGVQVARTHLGRSTALGRVLCQPDLVGHGPTIYDRQRRRQPPACNSLRRQLRSLQVHYSPVHRRFLFIDIIAALVVLGGIAAVAVVVLHHGGGSRSRRRFPPSSSPRRRRRRPRRRTPPHCSPWATGRPTATTPPAPASTR